MCTPRWSARRKPDTEELSSPRELGAVRPNRSHLRRPRSLSAVLLALACEAAPAPVELGAAAPAPASAVSPAPADADADAETDAEDDAEADRLRDLLRRSNALDCAQQAADRLRRGPASPRLRAISSHCVAEAGRVADAAELVAALEREHPGAPWTEFAALAVAVVDSEGYAAGLLQRSGALLTALAGHPDALRMHVRLLLARMRSAEVLKLAEAHPELRKQRVRALVSLSFEDPKRRPEALAAATRLASESVEVDELSEASFWLDFFEQRDAALAAIDRALAASPRSLPLHEQRWQILHARATEPAAGQQAVSAAIAALLALRPDEPEVLLAAAKMYRQLELVDRAAPLEARLHGEFADSPATETLVFDGLLADSERESPTAEQRAAQRTALAAFLARPRLHRPSRREQAADLHFLAVRDDPTSAPDDLLAAVEAMRASVDVNPQAVYVDGVIALAERDAHLERAEALAREGIAAVPAFLAVRQPEASDAASFEALRKDMHGSAHDALGAVLLAAGRLDEADVALREASEHIPAWPPHLVRRARLALLRGDREAAEQHLVAGLDRVMVDVEKHPCEAVLEDMYREQHGSMRGYKQHLERLTAARREVRRTKVLATAVAAPEAAPPFTLERLDGVKVSSDELRGKITVIKFWYSECKPCVTELPEFQALADAYARDPAVEIVSIYADGKAAEVREWMRARGHKFDVLLDAGYCTSNGVNMFPTLWVLDREGRIAYKHLGPSKHLREEFGWRIESLRGTG